MIIGIINYGVGNIGSIENMLSRMSVEYMIISSPEEIFKVDKLILPGVGKFDYGMNMLIENNLVDAIKEYALVLKRPILGICLGAQLMLKSSEEGEMSGLGFFDGKSVHFSKLISQNNIRIPHMGWSNVVLNKNIKILDNIELPARFYFVHSYYMTTDNKDDIMFTSIYGDEFISGLHKSNIYAVQFHPEKSHKYGLKMLENFIKI
jgi:glutamine amidotransferase